jgi:hypothetical protein
VWKYRRRIPADPRALIGRRELVRSLRARSLTDARRLAGLLDARVWRVFDVLRESEMDAQEAERLIERLCDEYLRELIEEDRRERRHPVFDTDSTLEGVGWAMSLEAEDLDSGKVEHVRGDALRLLAEAGQELTGSALDDLLYELARTRLVALKAISEERQGDLHGVPRGGEFARSGALLRARPQSAPVAPTEAPAKPSPLLSEVISKYIEDHEGKTWAPRTALMIESALAEALQHIGDAPQRSVRGSGRATGFPWCCSSLAPVSKRSLSLRLRT